ncbi:hypothetical protein [Cohaesibacter celericrescens]|uniref:Uncharacterized protein n=1 Tax=Cohaesibacter celericrescens TaxID=2067669 RepID=A0A2N5XQ16_9HYPH|nr:hypothetical protein [Cohaesibacter celericrescens]PLW76520.1 hypothetical protein C0081_14250 [Cohaesibacter celericrescens]
MNSLEQDSKSDFLRRPLAMGAPITYWNVSAIAEEQYDVEPKAMSGEMDAQFFLTKEKNFIPHEYPCRTKFVEDYRDKRPLVRDEQSTDHVWLPFGSPRLDLSGFWFRATRLAAWAQTCIDAKTAGKARLKLRTCGGAVVWVNGKGATEISTYVRNYEQDVTFEVELEEGINELKIFFDDLAERDTRYFFQLDYLSGPDAQIALPVASSAAVAGQIETALDRIHFSKPAYSAGDVVMILPATVDCDVDVTITVEGDFLSQEKQIVKRTLKAGEELINVGHIEEFHSDFRHFEVCFTADGFSAERPFTVEVAHCEAQSDVPTTQSERVDEAFQHVAHKGYDDAISALARLAVGLGDATTERMIRASLPKITACHDCADFHLVPLLFGRIRYGHLLSDTLLAEIDAATLEFRYWLDEPGNDVQWYYSENHALLFHTAAYLAGHFHTDKSFVRSGKIGSEHSAAAAKRLRAWFDHFEEWEMAEFNSVPYFPIDLKGLATLAALAHDEDIKARARRAVLRLIKIVACSAHHGIMTGAQGRSYEHTLMAARTSELSAIARVLWGRGWYGRCFHCLPQVLICLRDFDLQVPQDYRDIAILEGGQAQEWVFAQAENKFSKLYHYKTSSTAMGSAVRYRWGEWGYQETILQLRIGKNPDAQIWVNHPGEEIHCGFGRPSYWGGCGTLPRVHQYRDLAIAIFDAHEDQPDFSHIWFPQSVFDEVEILNKRVSARSGDGYAEVLAGSALKMVTHGPTANNELRQYGRKTVWIVRLGNAAQNGSFSGFKTRFSDLAFSLGDDGVITIEDADYGTVAFATDGIIQAEGRNLDPSNWTVEGLFTQL